MSSPRAASARCVGAALTIKDDMWHMHAYGAECACILPQNEKLTMSWRSSPVAPSFPRHPGTGPLSSPGP
eukprot:scaffold26758_cov64-Phaeocystis_antarctica.AAC.4